MLGATLLYYDNIDSTVSIVACPIRSGPNKSSSGMEPVRAEQLEASYGNTPIAFVSDRYMGVLSSAPDLDLGAWQVMDSATGELVYCDYFGQELDLDGASMFFKTGRHVLAGRSGGQWSGFCTAVQLRPGTELSESVQSGDSDFLQFA